MERRDAARQVCVKFASAPSHHMRLLARALLLLLAPPSAFSRACQPLFPHLTRRTGLCALPHDVREVWWLNEAVGYTSSTEFIEALRTARQEASSYQQQQRPRYHAPHTSQRAASHEMDNTTTNTMAGTTTTTASVHNHNDVGRNDCYYCYIVCLTRDCMKRVLHMREGYLPRHILVCPKSTQRTCITTVTETSDRRCHDAVSPGRRLCDSSSHTTTTNNITPTATSTADVCKGRVTVGASDVDDVKNKTAMANDGIVPCHVALPDISDDTLLYNHPAATAQCVKELTRQLGELWRQIEQQQNEEGQSGEYIITTITTGTVVKEDERASVWALILREAVLASLQCERCLYGTITTTPTPSSPSSRPIRPRLPIYASILLGNGDVGKEEGGGGGNMRQIRGLVPMEWLRGMRVQREFHITTEFFGSQYPKRRSTTPAHEAAREHRLVQLVALAGQRVQVTLLCVVRNAKAVAIVVRNACRDTRTQSGCEGAEEEEEEEEDDMHSSRHSEAEEQNEEDEEGRSIAADVRRGDTEDEDTACCWGSLNTTTTSRLVRQEFPCGNAVAHITIATADGVAPVYSNVLCAPHYDSRTEGKRQVHRLPRHTVVTGVFSPFSSVVIQ